MSTPDEKAIEIACNEARKTFWQKEGIRDPVRFGAFCLSLLPIPVISAAGKALDRHLGDKSNEEKFARIWAEVRARGSKVESLEESVKAIAAALEADQALFREAQALTKHLSEAEPDFMLITEQGSYQELVHCIVEADIAQIVARNSSTNKIENTNIHTERTHLHANDNSQNLIHGTHFVSKKSGSVGMNQISQKGDISVQGSSVGFGVGGSIGFGPGGMVGFGGPLTATGTCPFCTTQIQIDPVVAKASTHVQCPKCQQLLKLDIAAPPR